ncbi:MAG: peptidoglycan-binding domain-containing protein [Hyphomicrobium sp.]|nr:peptidoglycan-binding protein [Hyphomicrobium sp.]
MTAGELKIASLAFAVMTATVAVNLLAMQDKRQGVMIETSAIAPKTFEAKVAAALGAAPSNGAVSDPAGDLGPPLADGAAALKINPPKALAATTNAAEVIRGIQRELNTRGYEAGPPDGVAGLVTRAAIMAYEHDYGLPLTATPTQDLLSLIVLGSSAPQAVRTNNSKGLNAEAQSVIRSVEQQLAALGYTPGKGGGQLNNKLNEHTARAIREFEADQKLAESGRISGPLVSRLLRLQGSPVKAKTAQK